MNRTPDERLDRLTGIVVRAGGISEDEADRIGAAPFLNARLRARIEERKRLAHQGGGWFAAPLIASRAVAALLLVTVAAALAFWLSSATAYNSIPAANRTADNVSRVVTGGTCALSTTDECAISTEEVLATLFAEEGGKESK